MARASEPIIPAARRVFLNSVGRALAGASLAGSAWAYGAQATRAGAAGSGDVSVMQAALALEHEGIAAYRLAGMSGLLTPATLKVAKLFMGHHEQHRDSLATLIGKAGGKPAEPQTDAQYTEALNLAALKTERDVLALATRLEQGAASAYVGQVASLRDIKLAQLFSKLAADEAVHWTTLNNARGLTIPSKAYLFG